MARMWGRVSFAAVAIGAAVGVATGGAGGQVVPPPACDQPYSPVATADVYPGGEALPIVDAAPLPTTPFEASDSMTPFDSDGDGTDDAVAAGTDSVTITRGDGVVTITSDSSSGTTAYGVGDLDADGHDDFAVDAADLNLYLVSGTVAPGTHDVSAVGSSLIADEGDTATGLPDGRLVVSTPTTEAAEGGTDVFDGPAALAAPPGSAPDPLASLVGSPVATVGLGDSVPTLLVVWGAFDGPTAGVSLLGDELTVLTSSPAPYAPSYTSVSTPEVLVGPAGRFVTLTNESRLGVQSWMWSLDDPCTGLASAAPDPPAAEPPVTAPPAVPVTADARFTG